MKKKFTMIDEKFICDNCHNNVDIFPGDRENECKGLLKPIGIEKFKDTYKIIYKCQKCGEIKKNIMAKDDNFELIIELSKNN